MDNFAVVRACLEALHGSAYIGQDEALDRGLSAVANIEREVERLRAALDMHHPGEHCLHLTDINGRAALNREGE